MKILDVLEFEEGYRSDPYYCTEGYVTIGIGTKIGTKNAPLSQYVFSVSPKSAKALLDDELNKIVPELLKHHWYIELNEDRQVIIKSMAYQLGLTGLFKFKKMIAALEEKDFSKAATEALDSRWYRQTPKRAIRHATVIEHGNLMEVYEGLL